MAKLRLPSLTLRAARHGLLAFGLALLAQGRARAEEEASPGVVLPLTELERVEGHSVRRIDVVGDVEPQVERSRLDRARRQPGPPATASVGP